MPRTNHGLWNWLGCSTLLAVGCSHTQPQPAFVPPPPPGWGTVPAGAMVPGPAVPAGPGCSSCGPSTNPAVTAPRYTPPLPAAPAAPALPPGGITLGAPVHAHTPVVTQTAFQPPAVEAHLGVIETEESSPTIPLPPQ